MISCCRSILALQQLENALKFFGGSNLICIRWVIQGKFKLTQHEAVQ